MNTKTYKYEEIFQTDPNNPEKVLMTIPEAIRKEKGWTEGTTIKISIGDQGTIILSDVEDKVEQK